MNIIKHVIGAVQGKHSITNPRSSKWAAVRKQHLVLQPTCAVCGGSSSVEVHHVRPFHLHPELELDPSNLITLCESKKSGVNCHLWYGHIGNFKSFNSTVADDAKLWLIKFIGRPKGEIMTNKVETGGGGTRPKEVPAPKTVPKNPSLK